MPASHYPPVRVGVAGLGRSGWDIHAQALAAMPDQFQICAVTDPDPSRRAEAVEKFGCRAHDTFHALSSDGEVEVIIVATPSFLHTAHVLEALANGKHVVCEKPFGENPDEAAEMIRAARKAGKLIAPFHNRRYEAHFLEARRVIESGLLGEIQLIRLTWHSFKRRWDWQTLSELGGGDLNNTGSHILDHALQLFGEADPEVTVDLRNVLSSGDAEDHLKVVLRGPGAPLLEVELSSACAFPQDRWFVMGDAGGLHGSTTRLDWRWVDWSDYARCSVDKSPPQDRAYPRDDGLRWQHASWTGTDTLQETATAFFRDFFASLRKGRPLVITPESALRNMALIENCKSLASVRQGRFSMASLPPLTNERANGKYTGERIRAAVVNGTALRN